jgi:hypothetical protein
MFALNAVLNSDYDAVQRSSSQTWEESRKRRPTWSAMFNVAEQYGTPREGDIRHERCNWPGRKQA